MAVADNGWLIIYGHSFYEGFDDELVQILFDAIDYAYSQRMDTVTMEYALNIFLPNEDTIDESEINESDVLENSGNYREESIVVQTEKISWNADLYDGDEKLIENIPQTAYKFEDGLVLIHILIGAEYLENMTVRKQLQIRGLPYPALASDTIGLRVTAPDYISVVAQPDGTSLLIKGNDGGNMKATFTSSSVISGVIFAIEN